MTWRPHFTTQHRQTLFIGGAIAVMAGAGWIIGSHFLLGSVLIAGLVVGALVFGYPELALVASIGSLVLGQLVRLPVGDSAILPNDIIIPVLVVAWALRRLASRRWETRRHSLSLPIMLMVLVMGLSLILNRGREDINEWLNGTLYFVRWLEYLALFWIGQDLFRTHQRAKRYLTFLIGTGVALAVLGFIQLKLFPDFSFMVPKGWDPHVGRLLSTWFDPNFLGGLFVLLTAIALGMAMSVPFRQGRWWWVAALTMILATVLTYSRSAYVGLVVALGIVTMVRSRPALFIGLLATISVVLFVPRVQQRVIGIRSIDETAQLRLLSYRNALTVIGDHPWNGVGYNLYKYVQVEYGYFKDTQEHSASGSDSSLLTIWATTGTVGLIVYVWLFAAMIRETWRTWRDRALPPLWRGFGLGAFAGLAGLFAHSQFVNGLQYPHLMEAMWLLVAMTIAVRQPSTT
ncbi:MAG: O-antigen ligase family protein [Patescibacteria group bacterium]